MKKQSEEYETIKVGNYTRKVKKQPFISKCVRQMADSKGYSQEDMATVLMKDIAILRNKLYRGVFSLQDLTLIASVCGYELSLSNGSESITINPEDVCKEELIANLKDFESKKESNDLNRLDNISDKTIQNYIKSNPERLKAYAKALSKKKDK